MAAGPHRPQRSPPRPPALNTVDAVADLARADGAYDDLRLLGRFVRSEGRWAREWCPAASTLERLGVQLSEHIPVLRVSRDRPPAERAGTERGPGAVHPRSYHHQQFHQ